MRSNPQTENFYQNLKKFSVETMAQMPPICGQTVSALHRSRFLRWKLSYFIANICTWGNKFAGMFLEKQR